MADSSRTTPSVYRGWRARSREELPTKGPKVAKLIALGIVLLALLILLAWHLWPTAVPFAKFFALPIAAYDNVALPPIAFIDEDAAALLALDPRNDAKPGETRVTLDDLERKLKGLGQDDVLILYVAGHGTAEGTGKSEQACLLREHYNVDLDSPKAKRDRSDVEKNIKELLELLADKKRCPPQLKLLILDADHIAYDPRLGIIANDFSRVVEKEVAAVPDPSLWVLLPNSPSETPLHCEPVKRSVFSYYMTKGLAGDADGYPRKGKDNLIDLEELVNYVNSGVSQYAGGGQTTQSIRLLHGGEEGPVAPKQHLRLTAYRPPPAPVEGDEKGDAAKKPDAKDAERALSGPMAEFVNAAGNAWRLHDQLQNSQQADGWSPIDYAPHLWRHREAEIVGWEARCRAGNAYAGGALRDLLPSAESLQSLDDEIAGRPPRKSYVEVDAQLAKAQKQFRENPWPTTLPDPDRKLLKQSLQLRNRLLFRLPDYLRWQALIARTSSGAPGGESGSVDSLIKELIGGERPPLREFVAQLGKLSKTEIDKSPADSRQSVWNERIDELGKEKRSLEGVERRLSAEIDKVYGQIAKEPYRPENSGKVETLLATPLLAAEKRLQLLKALAASEGGMSAPLLPEVKTYRPYEPAKSPSPDWPTIKPQAELEVAIVKFADPAFASDEKLDDYPRHIGAGGDQSPQACQSLGSKLRDFYSQLPAKIVEKRAEEGTVNTLLRLADARDKDRLDSSRPVLLSVSSFWAPQAVAQKKPEPPPQPAVPDEIDLVVRRVGAPEKDPFFSKGPPFVLQPYPNRVTSYYFNLINRSGRERKVEVELLALSPGRSPTGQDPWDTEGHIRPGFERLTPKPITLKFDKGDTSKKPIPFAAAEAPKPPKDAGKPEPDKIKSPELPSIAQGMVCAVRDCGDSTKHWVYPIKIELLHPRQYVEPEVKFDAASGKINVTFHETATGSWPLISEENKLIVRWSNADQLPPGIEEKTQDGIFALPTGEGPQLFAKVGNKLQTVEVHLDVDQYPRAFIYRVQIDPSVRPDDAQAAQSIIECRSERRVKIIKPARDADGKPPAYDAPLKKPLHVEFQVDAPFDAFTKPDDYVKLSLLDSGKLGPPLCPTKTFLSDRQTDIRLAGFGGQGEVNVNATAGDFKRDIDVSGLQDLTATLHVELYAPTTGDTVPKSVEVPVILDGSPPTLNIVSAPRSVEQGKPIEVKVRADDRGSGIKEIQYGFVVNGKLDKPESNASRQTNGLWHFSLPTKDLADKDLPHTYHIRVIAIDRVNRQSEQETTARVELPKPPPVKTPEVAESDLEGTVVFNGEGKKGITVSVKETGASQTTDESGNFKFHLPNGKYTLEAKGVAQNRERTAGPVEVPVPSPDKVTLSLE
jgi:hypothetical protein